MDAVLDSNKPIKVILKNGHVLQGTVMETSGGIVKPDIWESAHDQSNLLNENLWIKDGDKMYYQVDPAEIAAVAQW
jgi:hypothetical protein